MLKLRKGAVMRYENRLSQRYHVLLRRNIRCRPNIHRNLELVYVRSGRARAHIAGRSYQMEPGTLAVVFPNQVHFFEDLGPNECYLLICSPDEFPEYEALLQDQVPEAPVLLDCTDPEYPRLFQALLTLKGLPPGDGSPFLRGQMRGYALALLSMALPRLRLTCAGSDAMASTVHKILSYCDAHYTQDVSLDEAAHALGLSPSRICHVFGEKLRTTFYEYICTLRLERAKELLASTDDTVTQVCYSAGFGSLRAFNRRFRRQTGVTPSAYRAAARGAGTTPPSAP